MSAYFGAHTHRTFRQVLCLLWVVSGHHCVFKHLNPRHFRHVLIKVFPIWFLGGLGSPKNHSYYYQAAAPWRAAGKSSQSFFLVPVEKTHHWLEDLRRQRIYKETYISGYQTWMDLDLWNRWALSHTALKFGLLSPPEALSCVFCLQLLPTDPCLQSSQASIFIQGTNKLVQRSSTKVWMPYKPICAHALHISNQASQSIFHVMNMAKFSGWSAGCSWMWLDHAWFDWCFRILWIFACCPW